MPHPYARSVAPACLLAMLVLLGGAPASASRPGADRAGGHTAAETGRYYVVGPPVRGQPEYLYAIAVATLHDGNRFQEIFALNRGRLQPDGSRTTDPAAVLRPGWVLALPKDAVGARVLTGPIPRATPPPSAVPSPTPSAAVLAGAEQTGRQPTLTYGALSLAVILVGLALVVSRRRPTAIRAATVPASMTTGVHHGRATRSMTARSALAGSTQAGPTQAGPTPAGPTPAGSRAAGTTPEPPPISRPPLAIAPVPSLEPLSAAEAALPLQVELICGGDRGTLRLLGARAGSPAYRWLASGVRPPAAGPAVVVGRHARGRLWLDLSRAPDALTVTGDPAARLRQVRGLIDQLWSDGTPFTVVGSGWSDDLPAGCGYAATLADLPAALIGPRVLLCVELPGQQVVELAGLVRSAAGLIVAIVVGDVPAARWSLEFAEHPSR